MTIRYKLDANESPIGTSPEVKKIIKSFRAIHLYPDANALHLRETIASHHNLVKENILCGCGSEDLIYTTMRNFSNIGDEILVPKYGFFVYEIAAKMFNPGNPVGTYLTRKEIYEIISQIPKHIILVVDSAYAEYLENTEDYSDGMEYIHDFTNLIVLRSFSKAYGMAGLRLGWLCAHETIVNKLSQFRAPFKTSSLAQICGAEAIKNIGFVKKVVEHTLCWRSRLENFFSQHGILLTHGYGNYITLHFKNPEDANFTCLKLVNNGIQVLHLGIAYKLYQCLRISIGSDIAMRCLLRVFKKILKELDQIPLRVR